MYIVGKRARMNFDDGQGEDKWYEGVVSSYNVITCWQVWCLFSL